MLYARALIAVMARGVRVAIVPLTRGYDGP
jgi:hypothetical protein